MTIGKLIVLTGPAAVGKSTLAKALQAELVRGGELWLTLELDVFASGLPRAWLAWGDHRGRHAARGYVYARAADGGVGLALGQDGRRVLAAFHRSVAAVAAGRTPTYVVNRDVLQGTQLRSRLLDQHQ